MANIVSLFGEAGVGRAAAELEPTCRRLKKACNQAQKSGFSGAIATGQCQRFACRDCEIDAFENLATATNAAELDARQAHQRDPD